MVWLQLSIPRIFQSGDISDHSGPTRGARGRIEIRHWRNSALRLPNICGGKSSHRWVESIPPFFSDIRSLIFYRIIWFSSQTPPSPEQTYTMHVIEGQQVELKIPVTNVGKRPTWTRLIKTGTPQASNCGRFKPYKWNKKHKISYIVNTVFEFPSITS